ncbi:hypothetical protein [Streptomyces sp. NPDC001307]|uniref:hypothetical protein n=1 Tax=Streptomyces sp. NPDC001307 TaxID=3364560 RepID=UPI0036B48F80
MKLAMWRCHRPSVCGQPPHTDPRAVDDPGLTVDAPKLDHLGESAQPDAWHDGETALRQRAPHFADREPVHTEPAGQDVMLGAMAQFHQRGRHSVDEGDPVLRTTSNSPPPRPSREPSLMTFVP